MNSHGQAARFAYDPAVVLAYIAALERAGVRKAEWKDDYHGRTIRRWRSARGVTPWALEHVLAGYLPLGVVAYERWARSQSLTARIR